MKTSEFIGFMILCQDLNCDRFYIADIKNENWVCERHCQTRLV